MKQAKLISEGKLQEIPDEDNALERIAYDQAEEYQRAWTSWWNNQKLNCRIIPAPDFVGEIGKVYTEGVDYEKCYDHEGVVAVPLKKYKYEFLADIATQTWLPCTGEEYNMTNPRYRRIIAIPIKQVESEDELWEELRQIIDSSFNKMYPYEQLKQQFSITRKKQ